MLSEKIPIRPKRRMLDLMWNESILYLSILTSKTCAKFLCTGIEDIVFQVVRCNDVTVIPPGLQRNVFALSDSSVILRPYVDRDAIMYQKSG